MTALVAAVLVVGSVAVLGACVAGLKAWSAWLAFRREGRTGQSEGLVDVLARLKALEEKQTAVELAKLRR